MAKAPAPIVPTEEKEEKISLYFKNESSDKEYHLQLEKTPEGWSVPFQYGRRGRALQSKFKNTAPLTFVEAWKLYDKTKRGQLADGYTEDASGAAYQSAEREALFTGITPQLLNEIEDAAFQGLIHDPEWVFQEKYDGERLMIKKADGAVMGINKKGLRVPIPMELEAAIIALPCSSCLLDSEQLGTRAAVFDLMEIDGACLRAKGVHDRKTRLDALMEAAPCESLIHVVTAADPESKRALYELVKDADGEGLVGKRKSAPYEAGRPNSGGSQLKRKFTQSATVIVSAAHKTKRSVSVHAFNEKNERVDLGNVTISAKHEIPAPGAIVEVKYLYAYDGGSLYQPSFKGVRHDQDESDCVTAQLKFKAEGPATLKKRVGP